MCPNVQEMMFGHMPHPVVFSGHKPDHLQTHISVDPGEVWIDSNEAVHLETVEQLGRVSL